MAATNRLAVVGVDQLLERLQRAAERARGRGRGSARGSSDHRIALVWMFQSQTPMRPGLQGQPQPLLALAQGLLRMPLLGDVDGHAADERRRAVRPRDGKLAGERVMENPVFVLQGLDHLHAGPLA